MFRNHQTRLCFLICIAVVFFSYSNGWNTGQVQAQGNEKLPDLVVADLEVGDGNEVVVTIENASLVDLPSGWSGVFIVRIDGGKDIPYDLAKPYKTIYGGIAQRGGSSIYLTGKNISGKATIFCLVDSTQAIVESNEGNNILERVLSEVTPTPSPTLTPTPLPTFTPSPTPTLKPLPTITPGPSVTPSPTPTLKPLPTITPGPSVTPSPTLTPPSPSVSPIPSPTPSPTGIPINPAGQLLNILTRPAAGSITADSAVVTWSTSLPADSKVYFGINSFGLSGTVADRNAVHEHKIELSGLSAGTTYTYFVESTTLAGRLVHSRLHYFTTLLPDSKETPVITLDLDEQLAGRHARFAADVPNDGVTNRVVFSIDSRLLFIDYSWPFVWDFDATGFADGIHSFGAEAIGAAGSRSGAAQNAVIGNRLSQELSPVDVQIVSPDDRENINGIVNICAEIEHDLGLRINLIEFQVDGVAFQTQEYSPAIALESILAPVFVAVGRWDTSTVSPGEHIINVRVRDEVGNWGITSRRLLVVEPPEPDVVVTREVRRVGSYFEVTLHLTNAGEVDVRDIVMADISRGFQYLEQIQIWHDTIGESGATSRAGRVYRTGGSHATTCIEFQFGALAASETKSVRLKVVPILTDPFDPIPYPIIGSELIMDYATARQDYKEIVAEPHGLSFVEFAEATHSSDYLIMTCPEKLDEFDTVNETDALLVKMAELAVARNGVFGYVSPLRRTFGSFQIKRLLESGCTWNTQMAPEWNERGYLLIVGESEIVPAFYWTGVPLSDYPYANTTGDSCPELRVGRIVGDTAAELIMPIENSLRGVYYGRQALLISGPEDTWEKNVMNSEIGLRTMSALGLDAELIHTEFWITQRTMLEEGIRIKKSPQDRIKLKDLAIFLLQRIGAPDGAAPDQDLAGYSANQLAAWLFKVVIGLDGMTLENVLADADSIITAKGRGQGLNGVMWAVLKRMVSEHGLAYEFTSIELAAWLLWEETSPRGPLTAAYLGVVDIGGVHRQLANLTLGEWLASADRIITPDLSDLAIGRAQSIQAANASRGGFYPPWNYQYRLTIDDVERERSLALKEASARGVDLIIFYGHGYPGGWGGVLADYDLLSCAISGISFGGCNPVVAAFSCQTGYYDEADGESVPEFTSISEGFLQHGAAVYLGATKIMAYGMMDELVKTSFWASFDSSDSVGNILHDLKIRVYSLDASWQDFLAYYNLYGDPKYGMR